MATVFNLTQGYTDGPIFTEADGLRSMGTWQGREVFAMCDGDYCVQQFDLRVRRIGGQRYYYCSRHCLREVVAGLRAFLRDTA